MRSRLLACAIAASATLSAGSAFASVELITNGGFEQNTGAGQLDYNTTEKGWSANGGYTFIFTSADTLIQGQYGNFSLWGPSNGSNNGLTASPVGGAFLASDPSYNTQPITQSVSGLTAGDLYRLTFYWAADQQYTYSGNTYEGWKVSLGSDTQSTGTTTLVSHGFKDWVQSTMTFTAASTTETLSFLAEGGPAGVPPFALLDGVSLQAAVPEPATWTMMLAGFAGLGFAGYRFNRKRAAAAA